MLVELLEFAPLIVPATCAALMASLHRSKPAKKDVPTPVVICDEVQLVVALLKTDEGWTVAGETLTHESGVRISRELAYYEAYGAGRVYETKLAIINADNGWENVKLLKADMAELKSEVAAFNARAENRRRTALKVALAKRIAARETVPALLGGAGVSAADDNAAESADQRAVGNSLPAGSLTYDPVTQRVVATVRGDNVSLDLSATLMKRYQLESIDGSKRTVADDLPDYFNKPERPTCQPIVK